MGVVDGRIVFLPADGGPFLRVLDQGECFLDGGGWLLNHIGCGYGIGEQGRPPLSYLDRVEGLLVAGYFGLVRLDKGVELGRLAQGFLDGKQDVFPEGLPVQLSELESLVVLVE